MRRRVKVASDRFAWADGDDDVEEDRPLESLRFARRPPEIVEAEGWVLRILVIAMANTGEAA